MQDPRAPRGILAGSTPPTCASTCAAPTCGRELERRSPPPARTMKLHLALVSLAAWPFAAPALAQETTRTPVPPGPDVLSFYSAGLDAILTDPRDAGLLRALSLVDGRLAELAQEIEDFELPPDTLELVFDLIRSPIHLRLAAESPQQGLPVSAELHVEQTSAEEALALTSRVEALLAATLPLPFQPDAGAPGLKVLEAPGAGVRMGAREGSRRFEVSLGEPRMGAFDGAPYGLPDGVRPTLALSLDFGALRGPARMLLATQPDGEETLGLLERLGMFSEKPLRVHAAWGAGHFRVRYEGWAHVAETVGSLVREPIPAAHFELVPEDALTVSVSRIDARSALGGLDLIEEGTGDDLREACREEGLDLDALLGSLGHTAGFYLADSTGGGGFASAAGFLTLHDSNALLGILDALVARANELARENAEGRIRIRTFQHAGARCYGLAFPGVPVPFEASIAVLEDVLFLGLTPRALASALDHARSGAPGLSASPALRAAGVSSLDGLAALAFNDTPRFLRDGYGIASLAMSALANAVRSPEDVGREPGIVMPSYPDLLRGARPQVVLTRVAGDDLVVSGSCDTSVVASLTGAIPGPGTWTAGVLALGATARGAQESAREQAAVQAAVEAEEAALSGQEH